MWYVITHGSLVIFQNILMLKPCSLVFPSQGGMGGTNGVMTYVDHNSEEVLLNDYDNDDEEIYDLIPTHAKVKVRHAKPKWTL
jgi:hypothetical protein